MELHSFPIEPTEDGSLRIRSEYGIRLGRVWRRAHGDDVPAQLYEAAITLEDDEGVDEGWTIAMCATETEAIEAVIRWYVELRR